MDMCVFEVSKNCLGLKIVTHLDVCPTDGEKCLMDVGVKRGHNMDMPLLRNARGS